MGGLTSSINCLEVSSKHTTGHSGSRSSWYRSRTSSIRATNSPLTLGMHHSLFFHGLSVFFSIWRMVSREMLSANSIATTLSASSCSVQLVCPSGASLHVMATRCASCLPSSFRLRPGRGLSLIAASSPSVTNRVRTLPTVLALSETASATSRSDSPWSAFNSASARFTVRANDLPRCHLNQIGSFGLCQLDFVFDGRHIQTRPH